MTSPAIIAAPSTIMDAEDLGGTMMRQLTSLFEEEGEGGRRCGRARRS